MNDMRSILTTVDLHESADKTLERVKLNYSKAALSPVISSAAFDYHYGKLYKKYVDSYNAGDNKTFNEAGAYLHGVYFSQLGRARGIKPYGSILDIINRKYGNFVDFKKAFKEVALKGTGSYWVYLSKSGQIKTIQGHAKRPDIALLIDMWEHSYTPDFHSKEKYLDQIWKIIDWSAVNHRL